MNILFIANHLNIGGISSYLYALAGGLREDGHNVYVASSSGELLEDFASAGIKHITIPISTKKEVSPKIIISFLKLKKEIKRYNIDLLHSNSRTTQVLGSLLSRYTGKPHIFTCHGFFKPRFSRRLFPCWGKAMIAISREVKEHLISDFKLDNERINVINNGIDLQRFGDFSARQKLREGLGIGNILLVGIVARLSDVKGHTYLLKAMRSVIKSFPLVKLLIVGEGKMRDILVKETEDLGIKDNVLFLPQAGGRENVLAAMDVFVMPSLQEGLGLALMEAMAQGLAVVGSAVGGIKSLIKDGYNGLLVEPACPEALAQAIMRLLGDERMRNVLGSNARRFITDNFSKKKMVDATEKVYEKCLEKTGN
ncbi:MAG: glycosyltransferase family 4 protein [Candidatus Omnitrophica bacterium]|nr:glycosyltransferase family 4 protein [Candidatus Omnitrophota bacterium]